MYQGFARIFSKKAGRALTVTAIIGATLISLQGCGPMKRGAKPENQEKQKIPVAYQPATRGAIQTSITVAGRLTANQEVNIVSKAAGRINGVYVKTGDAVKAGQVLVTLETSDLANQVEQAEAAYDTAHSNHDRMKVLFEEGAISQQQWEQAQLQLTQTRVALDLARSQLSNTSITAPISGVVTARMADPGEMASPGQPLLVLMDTSKLYMEGNLAENQAARVQAGLKAEVAIDAYPGRVFQAEVESVNPAVDPQLKTFPVKILMKEGQDSLKPGMFGSARIPLEKRDNVIVIPQEAVLEQNGRKQVFIHVKGLAKAKGVTTGLADGERVEITSGLSQGDEVIVSGQHYLQDGTPVAGEKQ